MHKRNITLLALVLAGVVALAVHFVPPLARSSVVGYFYFPAILLTVVLSGNPHAPSAPAIVTAFLAWSLLYWAAFIVIYALLLEFLILRRALEHMNRAADHLAIADPEMGRALERVGRAITEVEARRRRHFVLRSSPELDLTLPPAGVAQQAMATAAAAPSVRRVLARVRVELQRRVGPEKAAQRMQNLRSAPGGLAT